MSLADTWQYGRLAQPVDESILSRVLYLVDCNGTPRYGYTLIAIIHALTVC